MRQYKPHVIAVARPHQAALVGEKVLLDGSRSYSDSRIARFEWTFTDGGTASGAACRARSTPSPARTARSLKITDDQGRTDYDFETVNVLDPQHPEQTPPSIQAAYWPTEGIAPGALGNLQGPDVWHYGWRGDLVLWRRRHRPDEVGWQRECRWRRDGFAVATHVFQKPGDYIVRVERANRLGQKAIAHLIVRVGQ